MSDRPARPEWRAAYLNHTLPRRALRGPSGGGRDRRRIVGTATGADAMRSRTVAAASLPLAIVAMLHLVPSA